MRFDVPTIGVGTLRTLHEAGGNVLAVEAGRTILLDREEVVRCARQFGITVLAIESGDVQGLADNAAA